MCAAVLSSPLKRTVDTTELISSEIEKAGNAKRTVDDEFINTPIEKATKGKRTVDETELVSSAIEKAGNTNARRADDAYLIIEKADSEKRTVDTAERVPSEIEKATKRTVTDEFVNTPIEKAGAD